MKELDIYIEVQGMQHLVGTIKGESSEDAVFAYAPTYLNEKSPASISVSLPLRKEPFAPKETRLFFEGLLPEGFSRRAVASWIKADENDYITILSALGQECLGAIKVVDAHADMTEERYDKLNLDQVKALAAEGATKSTQILLETHLSLAGASGKVGLYYEPAHDEWYLPRGSAPSTHIVKQSHVRLSDIVINEQLCILTAGKLGIEVPETFIINTGAGGDADILFATVRYDRAFLKEREIDGLRVPCRLHQEDFAQAMGISPANKYENTDQGYLKKMSELILFHCSDPLMDQRKLWRAICFHYLIGNTDCHIKNFSLLYDENLTKIRLAPMYDIVSTRVYGLTGEMSFFIGGENHIKRIKRSTFTEAAKDVGLSQGPAIQIFDEVAGAFESALTSASEELMQSGFNVAKKIKKEILSTGGYANL